jgi:hypothetical protein
VPPGATARRVSAETSCTQSGYMMTTSDSSPWMTLRLALPAVLVALLSGCASPVHCFGVSNVGPVLRVVDATSNEAICSATFTVVQPPDMDASTPVDPSPILCSGGMIGGCPPADAGNAACAFSLFGLRGLGSSTPSYSVQVSAPGYAPVVVEAVHGGYGGCHGSGANTDSVVRLMRTGP